MPRDSTFGSPASRLRTRMGTALAVVGLAFLGLRLWMPLWERRVDGGRLGFLVPLTGGRYTLDQDVPGFAALIGGGALAVALAILLSDLLRRAGERSGR